MKKILSLLLILLCHVTSVAQGEFITVWDMSKPAPTGSSIDSNTIVIRLNSTAPVAYTWVSSGGTSGSGSTTGTITGLPAGETIILSLDSTYLKAFNFDLDPLTTSAWRLMDVTQWGTASWSSMEKAFANCDLSYFTAIDLPDLSGVNDMSYMFFNAANFNQNIGNWDTSNVKNMNSMFRYAYAFNKDISNWDTSKVTDMAYMFQDASSFNQNIGNWNTSNVTSMSSMFNTATAFNHNIGNWDTSKVINMDYMFYNTDIFNQNIGSWDTSKVISMDSMFRYAKAFNQNIGIWNTSNVTNMIHMFQDATSFNQDISNWNTSQVTDMQSMFNNATNFNQNIGNWNTANVANMNYMFYSAVNFNRDISSWNTSKVATMQNMFTNATGFNQNIGNWDLRSCTNIQSMLDNSGIDCNNYSATLMGWAASSNTANGLLLGASGRQYGTNAVAARNILTTTKGWAITGDSNSNSSCPTGSFITVWDMSKTAPASIDANTINFQITYTNPVAYTWTASGGSLGSGTTTGTITGLPAGEIITLYMDAANFTTFSFSNAPSSNTTEKRLIEVKQWGTVAWSSMENAFYNCSNLNITATDLPDLSGVTNMKAMFYGCTSFNGPSNINNWNTVNIQDMSLMFYKATTFNQNIDSWNTANVTNMSWMFSQAAAFNQDIGNWNTAKVTDMGFMFYDATNFNQNIGSWNTGKVISMLSMFQSATSFNQDIGNWNTSMVITMSTMFLNAKVFNQNIGNWNTGNVTDMSIMFFGATAFNKNLNTWNTTKVTDMGGIFQNATSFNQDIGNWDLRSCTNIQSMLDNSGIDCNNYSATLMGWAASSNTPNGLILGADGIQYGTNAVTARAALIAKNWTITGDSNSGTSCIVQKPFITVWDMSKSGSGNTQLQFDITSTALVAYTWTSSGGSTGSGNTTGTITGLPAGEIVTLSLDPTHLKAFRLAVSDSFSTSYPDAVRLTDVVQWGTTPWTTMKRAFTDCTNLNISATDIPDLNNVTDISYMFYNCTSLNGPANINNWNTTNITDMRSMFSSNKVFNQDIGSWNTANVSNMSNMFYEATAFNQNIGNWNTANITDMSNMFYNAISFNGGIGNWDTSKVISMYSMFKYASAFNQNIGGWNTANVTDMREMFSGALAFNRDIGNWDTSKVINMTQMFQNASVFNQNIGGWNTANVASMSQMFYRASAFNQNIGGWDTKNVNNMFQMFSLASAFNQNIGGWDTSKVTTMYGMFERAYNFNQNIGNWDTAMVTDMSFMFLGATAFNGNIGNWNTSKVIDMPGMFSNATAFNQNIGNWDLRACTNMQSMLDNSGMDCNNYSGTLMGWAANPNTANGISLGAQGKTYGTNAVTARAALIAKNWTITGDSNSGTICTPPRPFITVWDMSKPGGGSNQIAFNLTYTAPVPYTWTASGGSNGSGTTTGIITGLPAGQVITLRMDPVSLKAFSTFSGTDRQRLIDVTQWGTATWSSMFAAFLNCVNLDITATDLPDLSAVTTTNAMFAGCSVLNGPANINNWNTSTITNMSQMFSRAYLFNQNIGNWNTANVTNMSEMFSSTTVFNQDIGSWDTSMVTDMNLMFGNAPAFNQDIGNWNTANVTNMMQMFRNAIAFNQNIGSWQLNTSVALANLFNNSGMDCTNYSATLMGWAANSNTPNGLFLGAQGRQYGTNAVTARAALIAKNWTITGDSNSGTSCIVPKPFITVWDMSKPAKHPVNANNIVFNMTSTAPVAYTWAASGGTTGSGTTTTGIITGLPTGQIITLSMDPVSLRAISFSSVAHSPTTETRLINVAQWGTVAWSSMVSMFEGCVNLNITATDVPDLSGVTSMASMFFGCSSLNSPANINSWDTSNVTSMFNVFNRATAFNQNISNWNTANVTEMSFMFNNAIAFNGNIGNWNTSKVTKMNNMFYGATAFNQNIGNWNTSEVTDMSAMFSNAIAFNGNIGSWNTSKVIYMIYTFNGATAFNQNIGNWDTSKVINMGGLFMDASSFNQNIGNWDTSNVVSMNSLFYRATAFNQDIGNWNTANVTDMTNMLSNAIAFNGNISTWNTSKVTSMDGMFSRATVFNQDISNWDTSKVTGMSNMFNNAVVFNQDISNWDISKVINMSFMFTGATAFNQNIGNWKLHNNVTLLDMLNDSGMDCLNYSATLINWAANPATPNGRLFGATGLQYGTNAVAARSELTTNKGWTITGDSNSGSRCALTQTLTVADMTKTYGDAPFVPNATASSGLEVSYESADNSIAEAFQDSTDSNKWKIRIHKAGVVNITAKQTGNSLYEPAPDVPFILTINKAALSVTADAQTKIYGTNDPVLTYQTNGLVNNDTQSVLNGALSRTAGEAVGTYAIEQGSLSADNYTIAYTGADFTITNATLNIVADAKTKVYGTIDPVLTYTVSGLENGDDLSIITGALSRVAGEAVGTYAITQGTLDAANYTINYTGADLTITKARLNIVADAKSKVYGTADPVLTYTVTGLENGDDISIITGTLSRVAGEAVGTYAIEQGTLDAANYDIVYTGADLTITKATLNIVADAKSKVYGTADPVLTYTVTGLENGDTIAVITGALSRVAGEAVGTYAIEQGTLDAANYTINYTGADFTITKTRLNIVADAKTKVYGTADPVLTYTVTGLENGDDLSILTGVLTRVAGEAVGTYAIEQGTLDAANYTIDYTGADLIITKATLNIVADAKSKVYGTADPILTYTVTGFENGDDLSIITGTLGRVAGEAVGTYAIEQGTLAAANYTINYTGADLTITKATLNIVADAKSKQYGTIDPVLTYTVTGLENGDDISIITGTLSRVAGEAVGTYSITQGSLAVNGNYDIVYTGADFTITKATLNIVADAKTKVYGTTDPVLTYTVTGLENGDDLSIITGTLSRVAGEAVGTYAIEQGTLDAANYTINYTGADLTITKATLNIVADAKTKNYGTADPALTYTVTGFENGDDLSIITGALTRVAGEAVGTYVITQGTLDAANYTINYTGADLTITKATLTIVADAKSKAYGTVDPALTYTVIGLENGDDLSIITGALTRATGEAVGTYSITQGSLVVNGNYDIIYNGADLTITKATLNIVADAKSKAYGTADPVLTYTVTGFENGDDLSIITGTLSRVAGEAVGTYSITQGSLAVNGNYDIVYTGADFTITKATLNIVADAKTKVYGTADPVLTYTVTGLENGDDLSIITGTLSRVAGEAVGTYAIEQGTLAAVNYTINYTGADLTITKATLTIVADAKSKNYGTADPILTYTGTGLENGDDLSILTGALTRIAGEAVGTYAITQGTLDAANYTINYTGADLTITKATLTIVADAKSKAYGTVDPVLTYTITGLENGDDLSIITGALTRATGEAVGTYSITQGSLVVNGNYDIIYNGADLTITKATLNIVADAKSKAYGTADPVLTYTVTGFENGDDLSIITGALSRVAGEAVGTYAITQGTLAAANYTINYTGADFTITKATLNIVADAKSKAYGTADPVLTYTVTGFENGDDLSIITGALSRVAGEAVGIYPITQGTLDAANYTINYTGADLTITKATLTIVADAKSKNYGTADPVLTYTVTGLENGDDLSIITGALSRVAGEAVGTYAITQGTLDAANYIITYTGADLTIIDVFMVSSFTQSDITCYGGNDGSAAVIVIGGALPYTYVWSPSGGTAATATGLTAGTYTVTITDANGAVITQDFTLTAPPVVLPPTADTLQMFCVSGNVTISELQVQGTQVKWYATANALTELSGSTILVTGTTYYASQTINGCESTQRKAVTVVLNSTNAPVVNPFTLCESATVADLYLVAPTGVSYTWYTTPTGGTVLTSDTVLTTGTYYVEKIQQGCVSQRAAVSVTILDRPASPTGATTQSFTVNSIGEATIADLVMDQNNIVWYITYEDAMTGTNPLVAIMPLVHGQTYYAVILGTNGCPSLPTAVTVDITLSTDGFDTSGLKYYPNPIRDILTIEYKNGIDWVTVYNLLSQKVLTQEANSKEVQLNMSTLANGSYVIEIRSKKQTQFVKVIKK